MDFPFIEIIIIGIGIFGLYNCYMRNGSNLKCNDFSDEENELQHWSNKNN